MIFNYQLSHHIGCGVKGFFVSESDSEIIAWIDQLSTI